MLKPCPFCGCEAVLVNEFFDDYLVMCSNSGCAAEGPLKATSDEAETAWNTRPDGVVELIEFTHNLLGEYNALPDEWEHFELIKSIIMENKKALAAVGGE